jgi:hypothetical protein
MARPRASLPFGLIVVAVVGISGRVAAQTQPALNGYAVLGVDAVRVGAGTRVQPGAVGVTAGTVGLGPGTAVPGSVVADAVRIARGTEVGRLFCRVASGGAFGPGVVGGPSVGGAPIPGCRVLTIPIVAPELLAPVGVVPGSSDLVIPTRTGSAPVAAGSFAAVVVGRGSLLQLSGGTYQFRSIRLRRAARLVCLDECRIGVAESVRLGSAAQLGAVQGLSPTRVRVDVAAGTGELAFRAGPHAIVAATVFAPSGSIVLGPRGDYRGAFVGRSVTVRPRSRVRESSAFPPP